VDNYNKTVTFWASYPQSMWITFSDPSRREKKAFSGVLDAPARNYPKNPGKALQGAFFCVWEGVFGRASADLGEA
jgi:hypothetical protein